MALSGTTWPKTLTPLIAYVEERIQDGCSFSCVSEFHAAFTVLEQLGKVPDDKRLSNDPIWLGHVASWKLELELESRPPRSAKPYTTTMLLSLELRFGHGTGHVFSFHCMGGFDCMLDSDETGRRSEHVTGHHEVVKERIQL